MALAARRGLRGARGDRACRARRALRCERRRGEGARDSLVADDLGARWARAQRQHVERRRADEQRAKLRERGAVLRSAGGVSTRPCLSQPRRARRRARRGATQRAEEGDRGRGDRSARRARAAASGPYAVCLDWHNPGLGGLPASTRTPRVVGRNGRGRAAPQSTSLKSPVARGCRGSDRRNKKTFCFNRLGPTSGCRSRALPLWTTELHRARSRAIALRHELAHWRCAAVIRSAPKRARSRW